MADPKIAYTRQELPRAFDDADLALNDIDFLRAQADLPASAELDTYLAAARSALKDAREVAEGLTR